MPTKKLKVLLIPNISKRFKFLKFSEISQETSMEDPVPY